MDIKLLRATKDDTMEMIEFEKASSSQFFHAYTDVEGMGKYLENNFVFFILKSGEKVGAIGYEKIDDQLAQIQGLNILSEHRGVGVGKGAVEELLKIITNEGFKRANLMVHPHNSIAILTYMKSGFIIRSWRENYFGDGEPRLEMWKSL